MTVTIEGVEIGSNDNYSPRPCRFVAEISNSHNGDFSRALRMIDAAKATGAEFVKFQAYTPEELVALRGDGPAPEPWGAQGWTMATLYQKAATPMGWFPALFDHARTIGIVPFSSVFGLESLAMLERCACPAYKIAALDNHENGLIQAVASRGKPVMVSTRAIAPNPTANTVSLYCPAGYPTPSADVHLPWFGSRTHVGLSSHCLDPRLPVAAVSRGCALIEMHMMLADEPSELESNVSLTEHQFAQMIRDVRAVEVLLAH